MIYDDSQTVILLTAQLNTSSQVCAQTQLQFSSPRHFFHCLLTQKPFTYHYGLLAVRLQNLNVSKRVNQKVHKHITKTLQKEDKSRQVLFQILERFHFTIRTNRICVQFSQTFGSRAQEKLPKYGARKFDGPAPVTQNLRNFKSSLTCRD